MTIRVRYAHRAPDRFIEVRFFLIQKIEEEFVAKSGKHKGKKVKRKVRKQRTSDLLPTMSLDDVGEEVAQIVHEEFHRANKAILLRIRERQEKAAVPVKPDPAAGLDLAAYHRDAQERLAKTTPPSPHVMDAAPLATVQTGETVTVRPPALIRHAPSGEELLIPATVLTGETGTTQTIEPVFEVRPTRAIPDAGPPKPRTEADEIAEGMRLAGLA